MYQGARFHISGPARGLLFALSVSLTACSAGFGGGGGGGDGDGDNWGDGGPGGGNGDGGSSASTLAPIAVFSFDQQNDVIYRLTDENRDGDCNDSDEVTVFFDGSDPVTGIVNAQGLLAIDAYTLVATDNYPRDQDEPPPNLVRLEDSNQDGDALDSGESSVIWDGAINGGYHVDNPTSVVEIPGGTYALMDNNHLAFTRYSEDGGYPIPFAIYELSDDDGNGNISADERSVYVELSPPGVSASEVVMFDMVFDRDGNAFALNVPSDVPPSYPDNPQGIQRDRQVERISAAGVRTAFATEDALHEFGNIRLETLWGNRIDKLPDGSIVISAKDGGGSVLVALNDANQSGDIDEASEIKLLWSASVGGVRDDFEFLRDFHVVSSGTIVVSAANSENVRLIRLDDRNGDGDFLDTNETMPLYSVEETASSEELSRIQLSVSAALIDGGSN